MPFDPEQTYIHLATDGKAAQLPGGDAFWSLPESELEKFGQGWLITEYGFSEDWPTWEMHPEADEFVYLMSGSATMLLEGPGRTETIPLTARAAVVVPRGTWHTAKIPAPCRMLFVTSGAGTQIRPVE